MTETYRFSVSLSRLGDDVELFKELAKIFLQDTPSMQEQIAAGFAQDDPEQVAKSAHKLKGISSSFDETGELTAQMETLQTTAREGDLERASSIYDSVSPKIVTIQQQLQAIVDGNANIRA